MMDWRESDDDKERNVNHGLKETKARCNGQKTKNHVTRIIHYPSAEDCFEKPTIKKVKIPKVQISGFQVLFLLQIYRSHLHSYFNRDL